MLRLVKTNETPRRLTLRVEGRLVSPWLEVLERECRRGLSEGRVVTVDFSGVVYAGPAGIALARELAGQGVRLEQLSPIMAELIALDDPNES